jgi:hypothetical protein
MAIFKVSRSDHDAVGSHLKRFQHKRWVDSTATHHSNNSHVWRVLNAIDASAIRSGIAAPIAAEGDDFGIKALFNLRF